jgi:hypothetical protein
MRLPAVIGIDSQYRKRKQRTGALEGHQHRLPTALEERKTFDPACRHVRKGQGVPIASPCLYTAVGDQVCLKTSQVAFHSSRQRCEWESGV